MKKLVLSAALVLFACAFTGCRDTKSEPDTVVIEKEVTKETEDQSLLEDAAEEVSNEVDKEVSEEIDKIGDDQ